MKKIFILTGEASGDKLAAKVINNLNKLNPNIKYLSVGGENLKKLRIKSIYDLKEITYLGFTNVLLNIFKIKRKINETVQAIENFQPDILFTVDSPDFALRVAERVKKNKLNITFPTFIFFFNSIFIFVWVIGLFCTSQIWFMRFLPVIFFKVMFFFNFIRSKMHP